MPLADADVARALVVMAHPDDVDFGCAGTIAGWTDVGIAVTYLICTDGQEGGFDVALPRADIPTVRRAEQCAAARAVGVEDVRFLGFLDGDLAPNRDLVRHIVRAIRSVRPQRMLVQSPDRWWDRIGASHPDHLAAGEAAVRALYPAARNPFAFPELLDEGLEPWTVPELWVSGAADPGHFVDVTGQWDRKIAAVLAHTSQHPDPDGLPERLRGLFGQVAGRAGLPAGSLAEAFRVHTTG